MSKMMGVINLINEECDLGGLVQSRCTASVPFGGRYRLIDFTLSNMVNSGVETVAVFAHQRYRSLMDHLGSGKEWDLDRTRSGLFILPPAVDDPIGFLKGDLYHLYQHRDYFNRSQQQYVLLSRSYMVCNIDLKPALAQHMESGADITVIYNELYEDETSSARKLGIDGDGRITDIQEATGRLLSNKVSMEMYIMDKELLLDLIETTYAKGYDHLVRDGIMKNIDSLHVRGYEHKGYLGIVNSVDNYYRNSIDLLNPEVARELFANRERNVYTKIKNEPPTRYEGISTARNSLIANGCTIEGLVENSILFRGVKVAKGAIVRNSIVMQGCRIGENAIIENAILDKDGVINRGRMLAGDRHSPFVSVKSRVI